MNLLLLLFVLLDNDDGDGDGDGDDDYYDDDAAAAAAAAAHAVVYAVAAVAVRGQKTEDPMLVAVSHLLVERDRRKVTGSADFCRRNARRNARASESGNVTKMQ